VKREDGTQHFEHAASDATDSVFERKGSEGDKEKSIHALRAALRLVHEIAENKIPSTRIGLYSGKVIEARTNNHSFQFGNSISAANRL
jgi:class 3 adenylate cyclase